MGKIIVRVVSVLGLAIVLSSMSACTRKGNDYVGTWVCTGQGHDVLDIKKDGDSFLITDEHGKIYSGSIDANGVLVVAGVPMVGSLPLPLDAKNGEMICSACECPRLKKRS
jgi:hypothetical protein